MTPRVSVIVPARNERFLAPTVRDLLMHAAGSVEVLVVCDGYWPNPPLPDDPRLRILHFGEARGMRHAINAAAGVARGQYLLKSDAHCLWCPGYDEALVANCHEDNWILVPRRYALDPEAWVIDPSNKKYPIDYHYLSEPFEKHGDSVPGIHGTAWTQRRDERKEIDLDDEMTSQGSAWFMSANHFDRIGPLDIAKYGVFWAEFQEIGMKTWLGGGAVKVVKRGVHYAHLWKGKKWGRGYSTAGMGHESGTTFCAWYWMTNQWSERAHDMEWFIEKFWPVPTWGDDPGRIFHRARLELRDPYAVAA